MTNSNIVPFHPSVATSFNTQLVAFQKIIEARGDLCAPTPQEVSIQSRIISNVIRVNKHNATDHADKVLRKFFSHLRKEDKDLAKIVMAKYAQFMGIDEERQPEHEAVAAAAKAPQSVPANNQQEVVSVKVTPADFENNKHYLGKLDNIKDYDTLPFKGGRCNAWWLEYNLFQYCLPSSQRKFIDDAATVVKEIDHRNTQARIYEYLAQQKAA